MDNPEDMFDEDKAERKELNDPNTEWEYINSSMPYNFYSLTNPFLKDFDKDMWKNSEYSGKTETRDF